MTSVKMKRRICLTCGTEGWVSDSWTMTGVFQFNDEPFVELDLMYLVRKVMGDETTIRAWITAFHDDMCKNPEWLGSVSKDLSVGKDSLAVIPCFTDLAFAALVQSYR